MSIFQLPQHLCHQIEQGILVHRVRNLYPITVIHLIPIDLLVGEEAVVFIHDPPQGLEIGHRVSRVFLPLVTTGSPHQEHQ